MLEVMTIYTPIYKAGNSLVSEAKGAATQVWAQRKIRVRPGLTSKRNFEALVGDWDCLAEDVSMCWVKEENGRDSRLQG